MALFSLLALLFLSIFPTSSFALTEFQALQVVKNFAEAFIYPNNIAIAKSINSTLFAEDVIGTADVGNNYDGRELSTEYSFGLLVNLAKDPTEPSPIGVPISYEISAAVVEHNTVAAGIKYELLYGALNRTIPLEIDSVSGVIWLFQATTEQSIFLGLLGYRLKWNPKLVSRLLRLSAIQAFVTKSASAVAVIVYWAIHQRNTYRSIDIAWTAMVWILAVGLMLTQWWGSRITYSIGVRVSRQASTSTTPEMSQHMLSAEAGIESSGNNNRESAYGNTSTTNTFFENEGFGPSGMEYSRSYPVTLDAKSMYAPRADREPVTMSTHRLELEDSMFTSRADQEPVTTSIERGELGTVDGLGEASRIMRSW